MSVYGLTACSKLIPGMHLELRPVVLGRDSRSSDLIVNHLRAKMLTEWKLDALPYWGNQGTTKLVQKPQEMKSDEDYRFQGQDFHTAERVLYGIRSAT